ncbi:M23 family metallopeptidase [Flavobacterium azooxidireducens]|uniref:M23 family metallopeptidase n=1 Tax=Flavobacterium azooxidireducens TaxID=1871076 RepID=A0ABY4KC70_9FLAO|nr:M23 family metallopeptidase [Flavobacterium azooxidireducens]UPQ78376.1 M23 family metallopeptidase [Flavobacterium azooxidireducens]
MKYILYILLFAPIAVFSQNQFPKEDFIPPLDIPLSLSGTFGELRSNHFHSGIDFRTQQKEGLNVIAVADGYVSRIKISTFGYGKAIYITHPNGYTSVYGHLLKTSSKIDSYLKKQHYTLENFEIDIFPKPEDLVVKKGEIVALSGNTGGSGGPHLHFEYRDTKTEKIINPFFFGLDKKVKDTRIPVINEIVVYPLSEDGLVNQSQIPIQIPISQQKDGSYLATKILAKGEIGIGVNTHDQSDNNYGKNGVYKISSMLDGKPSFEITFDTFSYDETRYINAYIDYSRFKKMNQRVQKLFLAKKYPLSLVSSNQNNGIIKVGNNLSHNYKLEVSDYHGNKTTVTIPIQYSNQPVKIPKKEQKTNYFVKSSNDYNFTKDNISVFIPENSFYEDFYLNFDVKENVLTLQDDATPVHSNLNITFQNDLIPIEEREKYFIATIKGSKITYNSTKIKENVFSIWTRNLGQFQLIKDSVAPQIKSVNFQEGKWLSKQNDLQFTITDDLSGIKSYNGYLNGKWILFDYDYKSNKIVHDFSDNIVIEGRNEIKIVVVDNVGNSTIFESHFFRSQKP